MTKKQQKQFAPWFVIGAIGNWTFLAPIHELGHYLMGLIEGARPEIIRWNATEMDFVSIRNYLTGPVWELFIWCALLYLVYHYNRQWKIRGLIWANVLSAYFLSPFTSDLVRAYNMGWIHPYWWWVYTLPIVFITIKFLYGIKLNIIPKSKEVEWKLDSTERMINQLSKAGCKIAQNYNLEKKYDYRTRCKT